MLYDNGKFSITNFSTIAKLESILLIVESSCHLSSNGAQNDRAISVAVAQAIAIHTLNL